MSDTNQTEMFKLLEQLLGQQSGNLGTDAGIVGNFVETNPLNGMTVLNSFTANVAPIEATEAHPLPAVASANQSFSTTVGQLSSSFPPIQANPNLNFNDFVNSFNVLQPSATSSSSMLSQLPLELSSMTLPNVPAVPDFGNLFNFLPTSTTPSLPMLGQLALVLPTMDLSNVRIVSAYQPLLAHSQPTSLNVYAPILLKNRIEMQERLHKTNEEGPYPSITTNPDIQTTPMKEACGPNQVLLEFCCGATQHFPMPKNPEELSQHVASHKSTCSTCRPSGAALQFAPLTSNGVQKEGDIQGFQPAETPILGHQDFLNPSPSLLPIQHAPSPTPSTIGHENTSYFSLFQELLAAPSVLSMPPPAQGPQAYNPANFSGAFDTESFKRLLGAQDDEPPKKKRLEAPEALEVVFAVDKPTPDLRSDREWKLYRRKRAKFYANKTIAEPVDQGTPDYIQRYQEAVENSMRAPAYMDEKMKAARKTVLFDPSRPDPIPQKVICSNGAIQCFMNWYGRKDRYANRRIEWKRIQEQEPETLQEWKLRGSDLFNEQQKQIYKGWIVTESRAGKRKKNQKKIDADDDEEEIEVFDLE